MTLFRATADKDQPFLRDIRGRGQYDAVLTRFPELLAGFQPNDDGIAAADADRGRTASGQFVRGTDNLILFAKLNHRVNDRHSLILGYNFADYGRVSDFVGEESRRFVESHSVVGSLVSVVGERGVNELRFQHAYDHLDRSSHLPASTVQAGFQIFSPSFGSFGKPWWLPVFNHERNFEVRERFSLLSGNHEFRMGFTFSRDTLNEFFAGNADGSYDFDTVADFIAGRPRPRPHLLRERGKTELPGRPADSRRLRPGLLAPESAPHAALRGALGRHVQPGRDRARAPDREEHSGRSRQLLPARRLRLVARGPGRLAQPSSTPPHVRPVP